MSHQHVFQTITKNTRHHVHIRLTDQKDMEFDRLREAIINQAKHFLENAGEFYPFGGVINDTDEIVPLAATPDPENDYPQPQEIIDLLEKAIIDKLKTGKAKAAGVCIDVIYRPRGAEHKKSAIQVKMLQSDGKSIDYYLPYKKYREQHLL